MWGWKVLIEQLLLVTLSRQKRLQFLFLRFGFRFRFRIRLRFRIPDSGFLLFHTPPYWMFSRISEVGPNGNPFLVLLGGPFGMAFHFRQNSVFYFTLYFTQSILRFVFVIWVFTRDSTFLHSTFNFHSCNIQVFAFDIPLFISNSQVFEFDL